MKPIPNKDNMQQKFAFILSKENIDPSIQGKRYPVSVKLPMQDYIYSSESEENELIQYIKGEKSIFASKQSESSKLKTRDSIEFVNGVLIVDGRQVQLLKYLRACNWNQTNGDRLEDSKKIFYEHKPGEHAKQAMAGDKKELEARNLAYNAPIKDIVSYARVLALDIDRDPEDIRYHMSILASEDPTGFIDGMKSSNTKRKHYILESIDLGVLRLSKSDRSIRWANGESIISAAKGQDPVDRLVDYTFEPEGEDVYAEIKRLMKRDAPEAIATPSKVQPPKEEETIAEDPPEEISGAPGTNLEETERETLMVEELTTEGLIHNAIIFGLMEKDGDNQNITYKGRVIGQGEEKAAQELESKPKIKKEVQKNLLIQFEKNKAMKPKK